MFTECSHGDVCAFFKVTASSHNKPVASPCPHLLLSVRRSIYGRGLWVGFCPGEKREVMSVGVLWGEGRLRAGHGRRRQQSPTHLSCHCKPRHVASGLLEHHSQHSQRGPAWPQVTQRGRHHSLPLLPSAAPFFPPDTLPLFLCTPLSPCPPTFPSKLQAQSPALPGTRSSLGALL